MWILERSLKLGLITICALVPVAACAEQVHPARDSKEVRKNSVKIDIDSCSIDGVHPDDVVTATRVWGEAREHDQVLVNEVKDTFLDFDYLNLMVGVENGKVGAMTIPLDPSVADGEDVKRESRIACMASATEIMRELGPPDDTAEVGLIHYIYTKQGCCIDVQMSPHRGPKGERELVALFISMISRHLSVDSRIVLPVIRRACSMEKEK